MNMGASRCVVALLCVILFSLRSNAIDPGSNRSRDPLAKIIAWQSTSRPFSAATTTRGSTSETSITTQKVISDPFVLIGEDNILGPPPTRRTIIRRTRRRRIKKIRSTTPAPPTIVPALDFSDYGTSGSASSVSISTSTENVRPPSTENIRMPIDPTNRNPIKIQVVPIDSLQSVSEDASESLPSPRTTQAPTSRAPDPIFRSGHYTRHQKSRKRAHTKANLWKTHLPNLSIELFETDGTDEDTNSNVDKRESSKKNSTINNNNTINHNMFTSKPTSLSNLTDMHSDESVNPYVNTSLPISTELQNSLQFTLQVLHPLLNSDSVLTQREPKIPENKTVAVTHSLSNTVAETPIAPDLRFLPIQLRKSHPLLSEDSILNPYSASKTGPRVNIHNGLHSMRNKVTSTTTRRTTSFRTSTSTSRTITPKSVGTNVPLPQPTRKPTVIVPSQTTSSRRPIFIPQNIHFEPLGNLKITELVYPTVVQKGVDMKSSTTENPVSSPPREVSSTTFQPSTTSSRTVPTISARFTSTSTTPRLRAKIRTEYDNYDSRSPPIILMGGEQTVSELDKANIERPPAFDDLLLEELVKGFVPPTTTTTTPKPMKTTQIPSTTTPKPTTTTPKPTTTTQKPTTTTQKPTTTTPKPTTTTPKPTTTTPKPTTTTPKPTTSSTQRPFSSNPAPPSLAEDEASQLFQLLSLLQQQTSTPQISTSSTSTSTTTVNPVGKLDDDFLKNLALLENLLSPTAKTMMKEAVDAGTTEKMKSKGPTSDGEGLSDADLKSIYMLLDAMSSTTTPKPTTTTTPKPTVHPALQGMLTMLTNPWSDIQKMRAQQQNQNTANSVPSNPLFNVPQPPKPVPTTSSLDLLSQLFNLNTQQSQTAKPTVSQSSDFGLGSLFGSLLPKKQPSNREATAAGSNQLLNYFQPEPPMSTPKSGPYYWFDVNAFLGNDPNSMNGFRPKIGTRDYFLKVRKRRNSEESYY